MSALDGGFDGPDWGGDLNGVDMYYRIGVSAQGWRDWIRSSRLGVVVLGRAKFGLGEGVGT